MNNMREEILLHYMERYPNRAYWEATIPADPKETARIYAEVQREKEAAKRIGKRSLPPIPWTFFMASNIDMVIVVTASV